MQKVLLIPSWYPSENDEITGSFFREQAQLLMKAGIVDMRVLYSHTKYTRIFDFVLSRFKNLFRNSIDLNKIFLLQNPIAYSFISKLNYRIPEKKLFKILFKNYEKGLKYLMTVGWVPDVIHAQSTLDAGIFAHYLSRKYNIPYVIIEHQLFLLHKYSFFKNKLVLDALAQANKVAVVSEHQKKCVLMHEAQCDPSVIWNFVDENNFKISSTPGNTTFTVITITYPAPIKDYKTFFNSMYELSKVCNDFRFTVIGSDSFGDTSKATAHIFEEYCKELGIHHLGRFIPYLKRQDIPEEMSKSDVFVSTSIAETFGLAAREAMMCGLPVVTTACGGIEDSITKDTGIVVPIRDPKAVADAILRVKNREITFSPTVIRDFVINQCGRKVFVAAMNRFYSV